VIGLSNSDAESNKSDNKLKTYEAGQKVRLGFRKLHALIILAGALVSAVMSIMNEDDIFTFSLRVAVGIVIFYVLGSIIRVYMNSKFPVADGDDDDDADNEGESELENTEETETDGAAASNGTDGTEGGDINGEQAT